MRLFIAFSLNEKASTDLLSLATRYYVATTNEWYPPEKLHLTVQFLGDVDPQNLPMIAHAIAQVFRSVKAFELDITEFAVFGNKTLVALTTNPPKLQRLQQRLEQALHPCMAAKDSHQFRPHVTLSRNCAADDVTPDVPICLPPLTLAEVILYESLLHSEQSIYIEHDVYALRS